jgi:hypothetical protein
VLWCVGTCINHTLRQHTLHTYAQNAHFALDTYTLTHVHTPGLECYPARTKYSCSSAASTHSCASPDSAKVPAEHFLADSLAVVGLPAAMHHRSLSPTCSLSPAWVFGSLVTGSCSCTFVVSFRYDRGQWGRQTASSRSRFLPYVRVD